LQFEELPLQPDDRKEYSNPKEYEDILRPTPKSIVVHAYNGVFNRSAEFVDVKAIEDSLWQRCARLAYKDKELKAQIEDQKIQFVIQEMQKHQGDTEKWGRKLDSLLRILKSCPALFQ
jgi:hypothetical protein